MKNYYNIKLGRSRHTAGVGYRGEIPDEVYEVMERAWSRPFTISSDYARSNALAVAITASLGWITNIALNGLDLSRSWHLTMEGAMALRAKEPA